MSGDNEEAVDKLIAHLKEPPEAPPLLYKYVIPERIDVLQHARIRYTHLGGTNDVFEIRRTIKTMFGPRMEAAVRASFTSKNIDERIVEALAEKAGLTTQAAQELYAVLRETPEMKAIISKAMEELDYQLNAVFPAAFGDPNFVMGLLTDFASKTAALSVSDDPHSGIMWAHYAANWTGFVIAFDTTHPSLGPSPTTGSVFFPISYRDEMVDEFWDDPFGALFSKQAGWGYEREWRKIIDPDLAETRIAADPDDILLKNFDRAAVQRVVVGHRAAPALVNDLRVVLRDYPGTRLLQAHPDPVLGTVAEVELQQ